MGKMGVAEINTFIPASDNRRAIAQREAMDGAKGSIALRTESSSVGIEMPTDSLSPNSFIRPRSSSKRGLRVWMDTEVPGHLSRASKHPLLRRNCLSSGW
jgi:hypothetical protein